MTHVFNALFSDHPASVNEAYFEHMRFAATFAFWLMTATFCAAVHAIIPALFEKTAGNIIRSLNDKITNR